MSLTVGILQEVSPGSQGPPLNRGDTEAHSKGCSKEGHLLSKSIPKPDFSGSQERWISKAGDQPETTEPVHPPNLFQDGESGDDQRPAERGRLDGGGMNSNWYPFATCITHLSDVI